MTDGTRREKPSVKRRPVAQNISSKPAASRISQAFMAYLLPSIYYGAVRPPTSTHWLRAWCVWIGPARLSLAQLSLAKESRRAGWSCAETREFGTLHGRVLI